MANYTFKLLGRNATKKEYYKIESKWMYIWRLNHPKPYPKEFTIFKFDDINYFRRWYLNNYYEIEGERMYLTCNILVKNNKIYSPETCIFVPQIIDNIFKTSKNKRGDYPIGVTYNVKKELYQARISEWRKYKSLGYYQTSFEAFQVYKKEKERYVKEVANHYKDQIPQKLYNAMMSYEVNIDD